MGDGNHGIPVEAELWGNVIVLEICWVVSSFYNPPVGDFRRYVSGQGEAIEGCHLVKSSLIVLQNGVRLFGRIAPSK